MSETIERTALNGLSWAKVASALFTLLLGLVIYVWVDHIGEFREFKKETQASFFKLEMIIKANGRKL